MASPAEAQAASREPLPSLFAAVRARLRRRRLLGGIAATCALAGVLLLILLGVAAAVGPWGPLRLGAGVLAALTVAGLGRAVLTAVAGFGSDEEVARFIDRRLGVGDLFRSAVDLAARLAVAGEGGGGPAVEERLGASVALVRALLAEVEVRAASLDAHRLVAFGEVQQRLRLLGSVAAAWLLALVVAPLLLARGLAALAPPPVVVVITSEPLLADLELLLTYPRHTGLAPRSIPGSSGAVLAPAGTLVAVKARSLVAIEQAELLLESGPGGTPKTLPVQLAGRSLAASFVVVEPGGYRFVLHPPRGEALREVEAHRIDVDLDRPPRVDLAAPADDLEIDGPRKVELAYSVDDDYGLTRLELVFRAGDGVEQRRPVRSAISGRSASGKLDWDLAELELGPGARIAYHLEAVDNNATPAPNVGSSRTLHVHVHSPADQHAEVLTSQRRLLDDAVNLLGDRIDGERFALPDVQSAAVFTPERELADWSGAHAKTEAFLGALGSVAAALERDTLAPRDLKPQLVAIHDRLAKLEREEHRVLVELKARKRRPDFSLALVKPLREQNQRHVAELERDVLTLDDLLGRQHLEELVAVADRMARARDRLRDLLERYKKSRSDDLRRQIEREIRALQRQLAELAAKSAHLAGEIPDQFLNREAMGDQELGKRLGSLQELLDRGELDKALEELRRLSQSVDRLVAGLEGDLRGYRRDRFTAEERALGELEGRLADLEHDERALMKETEELRDAYRRRAQAAARDRIQPFVERSRGDVAELKRKVAAVDREILNGAEREQLEQVAQRAEDVGRSLEQSDLDQAREMARKADEGLGGLSRGLKSSEQYQWEGMRQSARRNRERIDDAAATARRIAEAIEQLIPRPEELVAPEERRRLEELRDRQGATRRRAEEALRDLERRAKEQQGGVASELAPGVKQAGEHMRKAEGSLGQGDPREAAAAEGQAVEELGRLRQQVSEQRRPRGSSAAGVDREPVKIPGADQHQGPQQFRQDLLEAMKRDAPEGYREQVKRYYQELAR